MAAFLPNPYSGPRLYALHYLADGAGDPATGGVTASAFANFDTFISGVLGHDALVTAGVRWFAWFRLFGMMDPAGSGYKIGSTPSTYPGGAVDVNSTPLNQVNHATIAGTSSYLNQIVPALDTAGRRGASYGYTIYCGAVAFTSPTGAAALDAHSVIAEALGATQAHDSQSVLDYTDVTNPHKLFVDRLFSARGLKTGGEAWERSDVSAIAGWLPRESMILAQEPRVGVAIADPAHWRTRTDTTVIADGVRVQVIIPSDGPTPAQRLSTARLWLSRGYDVVLDFTNFTSDQIAEAVAYWLSVSQVSTTGGGSGQVGGGATRSRLIAYVNCLDPSVGTGNENYTHGAVTPILWDGGWQALFAAKNIARLWTTMGVSRFMLYAPFGIYASADVKTIGATAAQAAVTSNLLGPRQAETDLADDRLVNGLSDALLPSFMTFWQGIVGIFADQRGEVLCYQGVPPRDTATDAATIDNWVREAEACGMSLVLDGVSKIDRLSYATPASILADRLALRQRTTLVNEHQTLDARVNGWFDGRFGAVSGKTRADLVWTTPASYSVPNLAKDSVVLLPASVIADTNTRVQTALQWLTRSTRGSDWSVAVELDDLSDAQITALVNAGGG